LEQDLTGGMEGRWQEREHGEGGQGFAGAGLADDAEALAPG
jgi:hypothetical protein